MPHFGFTRSKWATRNWLDTGSRHSVAQFLDPFKNSFARYGIRRIAHNNGVP
jgi:hypothetical protein